jgi:hypothetical protein
MSSEQAHEEDLCRIGRRATNSRDQRISPSLDAGGFASQNMETDGHSKSRPWKNGNITRGSGKGEMHPPVISAAAPMISFGKERGSGKEMSALHLREGTGGGRWLPMIHRQNCTETAASICKSNSFVLGRLARPTHPFFFPFIGSWPS